MNIYVNEKIRLFSDEFCPLRLVHDAVEVFDDEQARGFDQGLAVVLKKGKKKLWNELLNFLIKTRVWKTISIKSNLQFTILTFQNQNEIMKK